MKILHISTTDSGGAGIAAIRLHECLISIGINSSILFLSRQSYRGENVYDFYKEIAHVNLNYNSPELTLKNYFLEKFFNQFSKNKTAYLKARKVEHKINERIHQKAKSSNYELFSSPISNYVITESKVYLEADIIHLHWCSGFLDFPTFFSKNTKPVFISLHDEYYLLGGFHFSLDKTRNENEFGEIENKYAEYKNSFLLNAKSKITFISANEWMINKLSTHSLRSIGVKKLNYPIESSFNGILDKRIAKEYLNLPTEKPLIMFSAMDINNFRKGFDLLVPIINNPRFSEINFMIVGNIDKIDSLPNVFYLDRITDNRLLPMVYSAADYYLLSSRMEGFSYSMCEALVCGTPIIAFDVADHKLFIENNNLGIIMDEISTESIEKVLDDLLCTTTYSFDNKKISDFSKKYVDSKRIASELVEIYTS